MDCSEAKSHLSAFASGLTNDLDRAEIEEHLTACEDCSLEVELLRGRASGQSPAAKPSDWTLEKIFGNKENPEPQGNAEFAEVGRASADAVPSEETPSAGETPSADAPRFDTSFEPPPAAPIAVSEERPSLIVPLPPPEPDTKPAPSMTKRGSWDFEPADAGKEAAPPEESLVFAQEALNRKKGGANSKAAGTRAVIWTLGGIAGLGLLAASAWIAMAVHEAPTREISTGAARSTPEAPVPAPDDPSAPASDSSEPSSDRPIQASALSPLPSVPAVPDPDRASAPPTEAPSAPKAASSTTKSGTSQANSGSGDASAAARAKSGAAVPKPTHDASTSKKVMASTPATVKPVKRDDDDMWPTDDPIRAGSSAGGSSVSKPPAPVPSAPPVRVEPSTAAVTPNEPSTKSTGTPGSTPPAAPSTPPSSPAPAGTVAPPTSLSPIDRLHLATTKATADRDLTALRQLKTAWKSLLRTTVGRDRSRTKREYADCLWDIQGITGRDSDRLESLNAYRDYLLSAPAGGTDTRSAERLRELEDALHESD